MLHLDWDPSEISSMKDGKALIPYQASRILFAERNIIRKSPNDDIPSYSITYGPCKAVAEVSNHKEPIGRGCVALVRKSIDVGLTRVADQVAWLPFDLRFVCPSLLQIQVSWLSVVVRLKRFVCQAI